MSDPGITLEFPQRDVDAFFRAMNDQQRYLNKDAGQALGAAAKALVQSLGTSTKVAPKRRKVKEVASQSRRRDVKTYAVTGWFGKPRTEQTRFVNARNRDAGAVQRMASIGSRGLARASWKSVGKHIRANLNLMQVASGKIARIADQLGVAKAVLSGPDPYVEIRNRVPYIVQAMDGGRQEVSTAMERAARALNHSMERQLVRRMGMGSLSR